MRFIDMLKLVFTFLIRAIRAIALLLGLSMLLSLLVIWFVLRGQQLDMQSLSAIQAEPEMSEVPGEALLMLHLSGNLVERLDQQERFRQALSGFRGDRTYIANTPTHDLIAALNRAAKDNRIQGAVLDLSSFVGGYPALLDEVADAMLKFREQNKRILAVGEYFTQSAYFLAAHSDAVLMDPLGVVDIEGFGIHSLFFARTLRQLKLTVHAFVAGDYKSAPEIFTANAMSLYSKQAALRWTGKLWASWKDRVRTHRDLKAQALQHYADFPDLHMHEARGDTAVAAKNMNLIQGTVPLTGAKPEQLVEIFRGTEKELWLQGEVPLVGGELQPVHWDQYLRLTGGSVGEEVSDQARVAVVFAEGTVSVSDEDGSFDAWRVAEEIHQLNSSDNPPAALVLRINSPGGSVFASEVVRRAVKNSKIPVVASIGGLGASGGYYIATAAEQIWAAPGSITGSIGVFALLMTAEEATGWLGANYDGVGTSQMSGSRTPFSPLHPRLHSAIDLSVQYQYREFKNLVADSRSLTQPRTEEVARGQVWIGSEAHEHGLLDGLGTLHDAVAAAAALADLPEGSYRMEFIEEEADFFAEILRVLPWFRANWWSALPSPLSAVPFHQLTGYLQYPDPQHLYMSCLECNMVAPLKAFTAGAQLAAPAAP